MELSLPAFAQRVTVLGSTRKRAATSAGVRSVSPDDWSRFICFSSFRSGSGVSDVPRYVCPVPGPSIGPVPLRRQWPVVTVFWSPRVSTSGSLARGRRSVLFTSFGTSFPELDIPAIPTDLGLAAMCLTATDQTGRDRLQAHH